ncbi:MAG: PUA domain-containing protein [Candidatus Thorarchaeota archaeon]
MPKIERIKKRHLLKKREQKDEIARIEREIGSPIERLDAKTQLEGGVLDDGSRILLLNGEIIFFEHDGRMFPALRALLHGLIDVPRVTVDMGAVRFVVNGADIMRPGITEIDDRVKENGIVVIVDENHGKPLAVGVSKMSSEQLRAANQGKVIKSIHHINDDLWVFGKS